MRIYLSRANALIYTLLLGFAAWYVGHELNEYLDAYANRYSGFSRLTVYLDVYHYAISCVLFLVTSFFLAREDHYSKHYFSAAFIPLVYYGVAWVLKLKDFNPNYPEGLRGYDSVMDCFTVPGVFLVVTAIIAINYIICGISAKIKLGY